MNAPTSPGDSPTHEKAPGPPTKKDANALSVSHEGAELATENLTEIEPLTMEESILLVTLETIIAQGVETYREVGAALLVIRDSKLYKIEHTSFEDYCRVKWKFNRANAYDFIRTAAAAQSVSSMIQIDRPTARALAKLPTSELQREAVTRAMPASGEPSRKDIEIQVEVVRTRDYVRPFPAYVAPPEVEAQLADLRKGSNQLGALKNAWGEAGKKDRKAFIEWVNCPLVGVVPVGTSNPATSKLPHIPTDGLCLADEAINILTKIKPDDAQRELAFARVSKWLTKNMGGAN